MAKLSQHPAFKHTVLRYPRLDTVLKIEDVLRKDRGNRTLWQIWKSLRPKIMWPTFLTIIDYLEYNGKLFVEKDGKHVSWTWNPGGVAYWSRRGAFVR